MYYGMRVEVSELLMDVGGCIDVYGMVITLFLSNTYFVGM